MTTITTIGIWLFSSLTLIGIACLLFGIASWALKRERILRFFGPRAGTLAFIVAATATLGSLFLYEYSGFFPCRLCWYQRIFMYPQALILGIAALRKMKDATLFTIPLSIIGGSISAYHYGLHVLGMARVNVSDACAANGVSCMSTEFVQFGFITIPLMAFTAFTLILLLSFLWRRNK